MGIVKGLSRGPSRKVALRRKLGSNRGRQSELSQHHRHPRIPSPGIVARVDEGEYTFVRIGSLSSAGASESILHLYVFPGLRREWKAHSS